MLPYHPKKSELQNLFVLKPENAPSAPSHILERKFNHEPFNLKTEIVPSHAPKPGVSNETFKKKTFQKPGQLLHQ